MLQYFFHSSHDGEVARDLEGMRLPDTDAARHEAVAAARESIADAMLCAERSGKRGIQISDKAGSLLLRFRFEDAILDGF
jgi:hypothetical protein